MLEVPNAALGVGTVRLWARVLVRHADGRWVQTDRGARASQTPFLSGDENEAYRLAEPAGDAPSSPRLPIDRASDGPHPGRSDEAAGRLFPDLLPYDPSRPANYPANGRKLTDDAADDFVSTVTNGRITGDGIGPHADFMDQFPYLGPPHDGSRRLAASVDLTGEAVAGH